MQKIQKKFLVYIISLKKENKKGEKRKRKRGYGGKSPELETLTLTVGVTG